MKTKEVIIYSVIDQINENANNENFAPIIALFGQVPVIKLLNFLNEDRKNQVAETIKNMRNEKTN